MRVRGQSKADPFWYFRKDIRVMHKHDDRISVVDFGERRQQAIAAGPKVRFPITRLYVHWPDY